MTTLTKWQIWRDNVARLRHSTILSFLTLAAIFFLAGTAVSYRSLAFPWFWDDLHLVRTFSGDELSHAFGGTWDPDGIETRGYRPLTVVFYHVRAEIFGESVVAHRLFQIALVAIYLSILALIATELGMGLAAAAFAGVFAICTKNNWWNLVWIADGIHAFVGLLLILAAYFTILAAKEFAVWKIALAITCAGLGLFAREEALAVLPIMPLLAFVYALGRDRALSASLDEKGVRFVLRNFGEAQRNFPWRVIGIVSVLVLALAVLCLSLRFIFVPGAETGFDLRGLATHLVIICHPMGLYPGLSAELLSVVWLSTFGFLAGSSLFIAPRSMRLLTLFWFGSVLITVTPGLAAARPNLLFVPISFFSFGLAHMLGSVARISRSALIFAASVIAIALAASAINSTVAQELVHPLSLEYLQDNAEFVWGIHSDARVPSSRITELKRQFSKLGINSKSDFDTLYPAYMKQAADLKLSAPNREGQPFAPRIGFLDP